MIRGHDRCLNCDPSAEFGQIVTPSPRTGPKVRLGFSASWSSPGMACASGRNGTHVQPAPARAARLYAARVRRRPDRQFPRRLPGLGRSATGTGVAGRAGASGNGSGRESAGRRLIRQLPNVFLQRPWARCGRLSATDLARMGEDLLSFNQNCDGTLTTGG